MIKKKKLIELEAKVFEMEARIGILEACLNNLMQSQGMVLEAEKWYTEPIDN